ncbi:MAG: DUF2948 family protein [Alphaproteobacteria bacterium]|jgi:hypothetical protein|nr:DUF2948 family protein [Alphaproteobacteria bacterium]
MSGADDAAPRPLKLFAGDVEDLSVISAMVQDAIVPLGDIAYLADEQCFVLAINRYRWEEGADAGERVTSGLRFSAVTKAQFRDIDVRDRGRFLDLLTVVCDEGAVALHFAGGGAIRLEVEKLACVLEDFDEPHPTHWRPEHGEG